MTKERFACVLITYFELAVCCHDNSMLEDKPLALVEFNKASAPIIACNYLAAKSGVAKGMTATQAQVLCQELGVIESDHSRLKIASAKLQRILQQISPLVQCQRAGQYYIEIGGLRRLYKSEKHLVRKIIVALSQIGYSAKVGVAGSKFAAHLAAKESKTK